MRPIVRLSLLSLLISSLAVACSSDPVEGGGGTPPPGTNPDGTPTGPTDTKPDDPKNPANVDAQPANLIELVSGFDSQRGFYHPPSKRVFSLQSGLSSTLQRVTVAKLGATTADVSTLAVKGKLPTGRIEAMAYDAAGDRFLMIVRAHHPQHRIELVTIALGEADATFETIAQPSPLKADGFQFNELYAKGAAGSFLVPRGNELLALTLANGSATWTTINATQNPILRPFGSPIVVDVARGRLLSFGKFVYDPATKKGKTLSIVQTMPLGGPYAWTDITLPNQPADVPDNIGSSPGWSALDSKGQRFFTVIPESTTCPPGGPPMCIMYRLWVADLAKSSWTKLQDNFYPSSSRPFATDDDVRRAITVGDGTIHAMSLDDTKPLATSDFVMNGDLGPLSSSDGVALSNGKLLASAGQRFRIFDPAAAAPRWETFGKAKLPNFFHRAGYTEDPSTGEVLVFGGSPNGGTGVSNDLYALAKDGSTFTKVAVAATPPAARTLHGTIIAGHTLVVVGGTSIPDSGTAADTLDDVWTLDRSAGASGQWTKGATLPTKLNTVTLHAVSATEVWAIGWKPAAASGQDATIAPIVAIDLVTGKARAVEAHGATKAPTRLWSVAPLGSCFVGFESGDTVDATQPQLWRCKKDGDGIIWETTPIDAHDYGLGGMVSLRGSSTPDASRAFFVGPTLWATAKK